MLKSEMLRGKLFLMNVQHVLLSQVVKVGCPALHAQLCLDQLFGLPPTQQLQVLKVPNDGNKTE
jgi:hypothetical protein